MTAAFLVLGAGLIVSALAVVAARDLVHAAIAMVAHFLLAAALYVVLSAPFVAAIQLVIYAGAVIVLFLFVIMIFGDRAASPRSMGWREAVTAACLAILGGVLVYATSAGIPAMSGAAAPDVPAGFGSPATLGADLLSGHVLELEIVGVLLLVAMVGAVVVAGHVRSERLDGGTSEEEH